MQRSLLAFDIDRIKAYVFATDLLKEIRGASHILDTFNRQEMPRVVGGTCYYAHGGAGLFVVPTADVSACLYRVQRLYAEHTGGAATITGAALPLPDTFDEDHDNIQGLKKHLDYKLQAAKARNPVGRTTVTHPLLHFGQADGTFYATQVAEDEADEQLLSTVSVRKRQRNDAIRQRARQEGRELPEDFAAIAAASHPPNYFALIYADGDGLGQALAACTTLPEIRTVAQEIDKILRQVKDESLARHGVASDQGDTLLLGGDDIILAVPADKALPIALDISDEFRHQTQQHLGRIYTVSTAVVWAHATFPFGIWLDMAESALQFAKREGAKRCEEAQTSATADQQKGLVNFLVISSATHLAFQSFYQQVLTHDETREYRIARTLRPYTTADLRQLLIARQTLHRMPRSKLAALRQAVFQPRTRAIFEALRVLVHWRGEETRSAIQEFVQTMVARRIGDVGTLVFPFMEVKDTGPVTTYYTPIVDLAELWDFLPGDADED